MKNKDRTSKIIYLFISLFVALLTMVVIFGQDYHFHLDRLGAMVEELRINPSNIPIRILSDVYNGYGYGVPLFYGDVLFYIPAFLSLMGLKLINSYKLIIISIFLLSFISMYKSALITIKNKNKSMIIAALYVFSPYFLIDLCIRQALGEAQVFIFIPIVIFSFYRLINNSKRKEYLYLGLGMLGIVLSHNLTFVLMVFVLIIWFFIEYKKTFNKKIIIDVLKASLITILLSSSFTFPMIEAIISQSFHYQIEDTMTKAEFVKYTVNIKDLFMPDEIIRGLNVFFGIGNNVEVWKPGATGYSFLVLIILSISRKKELNTAFKSLLGITFLVYIFIMSKPIINIFGNFLSFIQFPWRLLIIPTFTTPLLLGALLVKEKQKNCLLVFLILCGLFSVLPRYAYQIYIQFRGKDYAISLNENYANDYTFEYNNNNLDYLYIPKESDTHLFENRAKVALCGDQQLQIKRNKNTIFVDIDQQIPFNEIELPLYYYKGYIAKNKDEILNVSKSENGLVLIKLKGTEKKISVYYEGTKIQKVSNYITIISILALAIIEFKSYKVE